jgi:YfiH family protein
MRFAVFSSYPEVMYGFSSKRDGSMYRPTRASERHAYVGQVGIKPDDTVATEIVHGANVVVVADVPDEGYVPGTDALITDVPGRFLTATAADCFLLYFYDPTHHAVGIAHAGWRGTVAGIAGNTVTAMGKTFGTAPVELLCGIGPGIRACHFSISNTDVGHFQEYPQHTYERDGTTYIDLSGILHTQLLMAGLAQEHIEDHEVCTYCSSDEYFSYRRDKPAELQVMMGYIGLTK